VIPAFAGMLKAKTQPKWLRFCFNVIPAFAGMLYFTSSKSTLRLRSGQAT